MRIPTRFRGARIDTWRPPTGRERVACEAYVASWPPEKPLMLLTGVRGSGKTHLACGLLWEAYAEHGVRGQFWPVVELLDRYRATFDADRATETVEAVDAQLRQVGLLVLDDWGTHKATDWADERLFRLVDERYREEWPLVITSNIDLLAFPERVMSRMADVGCSRVVQFAGADRRQAGWQ